MSDQSPTPHGEYFSVMREDQIMSSPNLTERAHLADEWDRMMAARDAEIWSEGHAQAMANIAWPAERKGNPYRKEGGF